MKSAGRRISSIDVSQPGDITDLLRRMRAGENSAADALIPRIFHELRQLAQSYMQSERTGHTLQPTALVNEALLRLLPNQPDWHDRAHFIGVTASVMRRILVDYARRRHADKRGGDPIVVPLDDEFDLITEEQSQELVALNDALDRLDEINPRYRRIVELRYFGGMSFEETGEVLGLSAITVKRDWLATRSWLRGQIRPGTLGVL
ncbi:MAG TPA: ECF-type sigma factor [Bryobacteraceae bacterium]|jgi:RNA polymerase sigma factor (TIGR02999 family)